MKISIFCHDIGNNALGRAYIIGLLLKDKHDVVIYGPGIEAEIWPPLAQANEINIVKIPRKFSELHKFLVEINTDIIYVVKPKGWSYGIGLLLKYLKKKPLIIDEDDWDWGFILDMSWRDKFRNLSAIDNLQSGFYTWILTNLMFLANGITVSSETLRKRFGGVVIPHCKPDWYFKVDENEIARLMKENKFKKQVILFLGTIRLHKGIDRIVEAIDILGRNDITLLVVGVTDDTQKYVPLRDYIVTMPPTSFNDVANYLELADLIVLPQKSSYSSSGQVPMKLFDAMAMGKVIISTDVSDIPKLLENCGIIVPPDDVKELSKAIEKVIDNKEFKNQLIKNTREKYNREYSYSVIQRRIEALIRAIL